jgi:hypothetical protein
VKNAEIERVILQENPEMRSLNKKIKRLRPQNLFFREKVNEIKAAPHYKEQPFLV